MHWPTEWRRWWPQTSPGYSTTLVLPFRVRVWVLLSQCFGYLEKMKRRGKRFNINICTVSTHSFSPPPSRGYIWTNTDSHQLSWSEMCDYLIGTRSVWCCCWCGMNIFTLYHTRPISHQLLFFMMLYLLPHPQGRLIKLTHHCNYQMANITPSKCLKTFLHNSTSLQLNNHFVV